MFWPVARSVLGRMRLGSLATVGRGARGLCLLFFFNRRGRHGGSVKDEVGLVLDDPLDDFTPGEFHGLCNGRGEVDIPLLTFFSFDELHFCGESHDKPPLM